MKTSWLKLSVDILDDHKIKKIRKLPGGNEILICWIAILCMAMKSSRPGVLMISEDVMANADDLSVAADVSLEIAQIALKTFLSLGMVTADDNGCIEVKNFAEHQNLVGLEYAREQARERKRRSRENQKKLLLDYKNSHNDVTRDGLVTDDIEIKIETKKENKEKENIESDLGKSSSPNTSSGEEKPKEEEKPKKDTLPAGPPDDLRPIWEAWQACGVKKHRLWQKSFTTASRKALEAYSMDEIIKAFQNYVFVLNSSRHFFSYKWALDDFLNRGLVDFVDENDPLKNYLSQKKRPISSNPERYAY